MVFDIAGVRDAIAIGENKVVAGGRGYRLVQEDHFAKAVVRVPHVVDSERRRACGNRR